MTTSLWMSNNGEIVCPDHGGGYLQSHLRLAPRSRRVETPITTWQRLTKADLAYMRENGMTAACDYC